MPPQVLCGGLFANIARTPFSISNQARKKKVHNINSVLSLALPPCRNFGIGGHYGISFFAYRPQVVLLETDTSPLLTWARKTEPEPWVVQRSTSNWILLSLPVRNGMLPLFFSADRDKDAWFSFSFGSVVSWTQVYAILHNCPFLR